MICFYIMKYIAKLWNLILEHVISFTNMDSPKQILDKFIEDKYVNDHYF